MKYSIKGILFSLLRSLSGFIPKKNKALIIGTVAGIEPNAVEIANQLAYKRIKTFFVVPDKLMGSAIRILEPNIHLLEPKAFLYYKCLITCKYIFVTHGGGLKKILTRKQVIVNLWHGIPYKPIGRLSNGNGFYTDYAIGTSSFTQDLLSKAFDIAKERVVITGYPRNDIMFRALKKDYPIKSTLSIDFSKYKKVVCWVPTYRRTFPFETMPAGRKIDNPFQIEGFDCYKFDRYLKDHNCLCILKPHPLALKGASEYSFGNIIFIDDAYLYKHSVTLYHLIAWCDIMISDFSSIIIDYLLLNKPVFSFCTDIEEYKYSQGLYFDNIEEYLPSDLIQSEDYFYTLLNELIMENKDRFENKRIKLRELFFEQIDGNSSQRLIDFILNNKKI